MDGSKGGYLVKLSFPKSKPTKVVLCPSVKLVAGTQDFILHEMIQTVLDLKSLGSATTSGACISRQWESSVDICKYLTFFDQYPPCTQLNDFNMG